MPNSHRNFDYEVTFKFQKKSNHVQDIRRSGIMSSTAHSDAFTVQGTKSKGPGRSLASRKTFQPGDLIATFTSPILVLPNGPSAKVVCNHCLAHNVPTKACTGCKAVVYCGAACQKANWGLIHKWECKVFKRVKASADQDWLPTPVRALVQVLLRWDADEDLRAAFGRLEGNVDRFRSREDVWKDVGLQAYGGMAYAGRKETDNELHMARDILCKVSKIFESPGGSKVSHVLIRNIDSNKCFRQDRCRYRAGWDISSSVSCHGQSLLCTERSSQLYGKGGNSES